MALFVVVQALISSKRKYPFKIMADAKYRALVVPECLATGSGDACAVTGRFTRRPDASMMTTPAS